MFEGENITLTRGNQLLLRSFSFTLQPGTCLGILGPNASGKSSLLRMFGGLLASFTGIFRWRQEACDVLSSVHRARVSYVNSSPQFSSMTPVAQHTTVSQIVLKEWGLDSFLRTPCAFLSQGQKQRLHLAERLQETRPLWLLDEPMSSLDPEGRKILKQVLTRHIDRGGIVCVVSHEAFPLDPDLQMELIQEQSL